MAGSGARSSFWSLSMLAVVRVDRHFADGLGIEQVDLRRRE